VRKGRLRKSAVPLAYPAAVVQQLRISSAFIAKDTYKSKLNLVSIVALPFGSLPAFFTFYLHMFGNSTYLVLNRFNSPNVV
jgi:hypothetical protein